MLVFARKDSEAVLFSNGIKTVRMVVRCDDHIFRLYRSNKLILKLETPQDRVVVQILDFPVVICLVRFRAYDDVTIGFEASRSLTIIREEFEG